MFQKHISPFVPQHNAISNDPTSIHVMNSGNKTKLVTVAGYVYSSNPASLIKHHNANIYNSS